MRANHAIAVQIECNCCSATMQLGVQRQCNSVCRSMRFRSQLPDYYVLEHLRSGALVSLLDNQQPPDTAVWALYPQQRHLSPKVRQLVEFLKLGLAQRSEYRQEAS